MTLQEWVAKHGGQRPCASKFNFSPSSLGAWCRGARYPTPANQLRLKQCSGSEIDFQDLLEHFAANKNNPDMRAAAPRRLPGSAFVRDIPRLKAIFEELELPPERCNLNGPGVLARWKETNVTVSEVRSAVSHLLAARQDAGSIELIHKAIHKARSTALGALSK